MRRTEHTNNINKIKALAHFSLKMNCYRTVSKSAFNSEEQKDMKLDTDYNLTLLTEQQITTQYS